jgi:hypothetical protein
MIWGSLRTRDEGRESLIWVLPSHVQENVPFLFFCTAERLKGFSARRRGG